ncbi:MAG: hypothetical protein V1911_02345 [Candidatus Micrarchaeota archaeon]
MKLNRAASKKNSAQGSLEYLVILGAVITVSALVVVYLAGSSGESAKNVQIQECVSAAAKCEVNHFSNPADPCNFCAEDCADSTGAELLPGAIECCRAGEKENIYEGSTACGAVSCTEETMETVCPTKLCKDKDCISGTCTYTPSDDGTSCGTGKTCQGGYCLPGCEDDTSRACTTSESCAGTQWCSDGVWGACTDTPDDGCPGQCTEATVETDCPDQTCRTKACTLGQCVYTVKADHIACTGGVCSSGDCIGCIDASDCPAPTVPCKETACTADTCGFNTLTVTANAGSDVTTPTSSNLLPGDCAAGLGENVITEGSSGLSSYSFSATPVCNSKKFVIVNTDGKHIARKFVNVIAGTEATVSFDAYLYGSSGNYDTVNVETSTNGIDWSACLLWNPVLGEAGGKWTTHSVICKTPMNGDFYVRINLGGGYGDQMAIGRFDVTFANGQKQFNMVGTGTPTTVGTKLTEYAWDYNNDGTYDWSSTLAGNSYQFPLPGTCTVAALLNKGVNFQGQDGLSNSPISTADTCAGRKYRLDSGGSDWISRQIPNVKAGMTITVAYDAYLYDNYLDYDVIKVENSTDGTTWYSCPTSWNPVDTEDYGVWSSHTATCTVLSPGTMYVRIRPTDNGAVGGVPDIAIGRFDLTVQAGPGVTYYPMSISVPHTFTTSGTHTPKLLVKDDTGCTGTDTAVYTIN